MVRIQVKHFGPIIEGSIELKPLSVFIGPNNSGKSYFAVLSYALMTGLARSALRFTRRSLMKMIPQKRKGRFITCLSDWYTDRKEEFLIKQRVIQIKEFPQEVREALRQAVITCISGSLPSFAHELQRCFGSKIGDLVTKGVGAKTFSMVIEQGRPVWRVTLRSENNSLSGQGEWPDISDLTIRIRSGEFARLMALRSPRGAGRVTVAMELAGTIVRSILRELYSDIIMPAYYLPAARSGILQSHKAIASSLVRRSPFAGIEEIEIPKLSGVVSDFIGELLSLEREEGGKFSRIGRFLEREVLKGRIRMQVGKLEYPEIYYRPEIGRFDVHRTSSMVSELAPVVLFLKYGYLEHGYLVIEEPESHLHPESQVKLARAIIKLVRAGLKVLITTHSDFFTGKLNNFIKLSKASSSDRINHGYSRDDYIKAEEVAAYLFKLSKRKGGSLVERLAVTEEDGIPEEEFVKVAASLHGETVRLERGLSQ